jgi:hypothetical protein
MLTHDPLIPDVEQDRISGHRISGHQDIWTPGYLDTDFVKGE